GVVTEDERRGTREQRGHRAMESGADDKIELAHVVDPSFYRPVDARMVLGPNSQRIYVGNRIGEVAAQLLQRNVGLAGVRSGRKDHFFALRLRDENAIVADRLLD